MSDKDQVSEVITKLLPFEEIDLVTLARRSGLSRSKKRFSSCIEQLVDEGILIRSDVDHVTRNLFCVEEIKSFLADLQNCRFNVSQQSTAVKLTISPSTGGEIVVLLGYSEAERLSNGLGRHNIEAFMQNI